MSPWVLSPAYVPEGEGQRGWPGGCSIYNEALSGPWPLTSENLSWPRAYVCAWGLEGRAVF